LPTLQKHGVLYFLYPHLPSPTLALRPNATLSSPASARAPAPFFWDKVLLLGNEGSFKTLYLLSRSSFDGDSYRGRENPATPPPTELDPWGRGPRASGARDRVRVESGVRASGARDARRVGRGTDEHRT